MRQIKFRAWDIYGKRMVNPKQFAELLSVKEYARKPEPQKRLKHVRHSVLVKKGKGLFGLDEYADTVDTKEEAIEMEAKKFSANPFTDKDLILMQYTGLKDRNGKEIYEGDILKSSYTDFGHEVAFSRGSFIIKHNDRCCPPYRTSLPEADGWQEIIGNIYENKDLLK